MAKDRPKPDRRKVPKLFRAVERDSNPTTYYGSLISDDLINVVCLAVHNGESSIVKERILEKRNYTFSAISKEEMSIHARRGLIKMAKDTEEHRMEMEAAEAIHFSAKKQIEEIVGPI